MFSALIKKEIALSRRSLHALVKFISVALPTVIANYCYRENIFAPFDTILVLSSFVIVCTVGAIDFFLPSIFDEKENNISVVTYAAKLSSRKELMVKAIVPLVLSSFGILLAWVGLVIFHSSVSLIIFRNLPVLLLSVFFSLLTTLLFTRNKNNVAPATTTMLVRVVSFILHFIVSVMGGFNSGITIY